ncbi:MAG: hypothetical protein JSU58_06900 [Dehalococcoidales bacterium]|nr:MAG: hypothetical protein JSU58_06900 [Dehalococcoidales bacterium]
MKDDKNTKDEKEGLLLVIGEIKNKTLKRSGWPSRIVPKLSFEKKEYVPVIQETLISYLE